MTRFHLYPMFLLCLPFCGLPPAADAAPPVLSVELGARTRAAPAGAVWVFPSAHLLSDDAPLTHTFLLHNGEKKPLRIVRVAASCECISAQIGGASLPVTLAPGETLPAALRLSPRRLLPGPFSKSVWLYWPGGPRDGLQLELRGTVRDDSVPAGSVSGASAH